MYTIPFDPPKFECSEEIFGALSLSVCIPLATYGLYDASKAYLKTRTLFLLNFVVLFSSMWLYQILVAVSIYLTNHVGIMMVRVWTYCVAVYVLQVRCTHDILEIFAKSKMLPEWFPMVVFVVMNIMYIGMYTPRWFMYSLFISPLEKNALAQWYGKTVTPFTYFSIAVSFVTCAYAVGVLFLKFNQFAKAGKHSSGSSSTSVVNGSASTAEMPASNTESASGTESGVSKQSVTKMVRGAKNFAVSTKGVAVKLLLWVLLYVATTIICMILVTMAENIVRPPPSLGWRKSQNLIGGGASFTVIGCFGIWKAMTGLKNLRGLKAPSTGNSNSSKKTLKMTT
ncbi:hypothetical protein BC831DRAFT_469463 [Entophlyctis helioformis]|nr:hypothetical protein BC831DRAFT_469463 [Entophlyctis helioformis]